MQLGGRRVSIEPEHVIYANNAFDQLAGAVKEISPGKSCTVVMDTRTREVAGRHICMDLRDAALSVSEVIVPDRDRGRSPACDEATYHSLLETIGEVEVIVSVGSGVINDLCKWSAYTKGVRYIAVATAASMNGYTSANVAAAINGVKVLERSRPPKAVFSTPELITGAPYELTASGLGDIAAKTVSSTDWYLNHVLFGDEFIRESVDLTIDVEPLYMDHGELIRAKEDQAIEALFHGLMLTGAAMTMAGTSAPASGGEHLVSHALDMMSTIRGVEHDLHGRQVGVGTIITAELYRRLLALESPVWDQERATVKDFGFWESMSGPVAEIYAPKAHRIGAAVQWLRSGDWDSLRETLSEMVRPPEDLKNCFRMAGAAHRAEDIRCSREYLLEAFLHCHEMRARFTVVDMAWLAGLLPGCAAEIVEAFA